MSQPVTWDQLMEAAEDSDKFLGIHGIRGESMTVWLNALYESQGQRIIENPEAPAAETQLSLDTEAGAEAARDRKSTRLNSSHVAISYAVYCLNKNNKHIIS